MTAEHHLVTDDTNRASDSLLEALRRWRAVDRSATEPVVAGLRVIDANRPVVERAKGEGRSRRRIARTAPESPESRHLRPPFHGVGGTGCAGAPLTQMSAPARSARPTGPSQV